MANLIINDDNQARRIYKTASSELREILENSYTKEFFSVNIMDRIKSFEDACEYNNTDSNARRFRVGTKNQIYHERVAEIVKALNEGWVPNYDNDEYKYSPFFYLRVDATNPSGFRFLDSFCAFAYADTSGGSRFALKNRSLSDYAGKHFENEYKNWLMPDKTEDRSNTVGTTLGNKEPFKGDMKAWEAYIMPRCTSFEDACLLTGEDPDDGKFYYGEADDISYQKGKVIVRALNGSWILNWKDKSQKKYQAWLEHDGTGFRFGGSIYVITCAGTAGGSRLRLCSDVLAKYFATQFSEAMMPFWE